MRSVFGNPSLPTFYKQAPGSPGYDKLGKITPIITALLERFRAVYEPGKNISIDEAMIRFKGRSTIKQYLPMKPIKRELKCG